MPPGWQRIFAEAKQPLVPGSCIYGERSMSGQNRTPVDKLSGYILSGAQVAGELPFTLDELVESLLVNGPLIQDVATGELYDGIVESDPHEFVQCVNAGNDKIYMQWERYDAESPWIITPFKDYDTQPRQVGEPSETPAAAIIYYHNPTCPEGILYHAQDTYRVVEKGVD